MEKPKKVIEKETVQKLVKEAYYKDEQTGRAQIVQVKDADGNITEEERPETIRVLVPAEFKEQEKQKEMWHVVDGDEVHKFTKEEDAKRFYGGK